MTNSDMVIGQVKTTRKPLDKDEIQRKVQQVLLDTGLDNKFPFPAEELANMLGYDSYYFTPGEKTRQISGAVEHDKKRILINKNDPVRRQLFTLAHEIGHIVLHKDQGNRLDFRTSLNKWDSMEEEADNFAGMLLMPEDEFKNQWGLSLKDFYSISSYFGVSEAAARVRASILQLK